MLTGTLIGKDKVEFSCNFIEFFYKGKELWVNRKTLDLILIKGVFIIETLVYFGTEKLWVTCRKENLKCRSCRIYRKRWPKKRWMEWTKQWTGEWYLKDNGRRKFVASIPNRNEKMVRRLWCNLIAIYLCYIGCLSLMNLKSNNALGLSPFLTEVRPSHLLKNNKNIYWFCLI